MDTAPSKGASANESAAFAAVVAVYVLMYFEVIAWAIAAARMFFLWFVNAEADKSGGTSCPRQEQQSHSNQNEEGVGKNHHDESGTTDSSKNDRLHQWEDQQRWDKSREGRKRYELPSYVSYDTQRGKLYWVATHDFRMHMPLPDFFQIAEREWMALVVEADRSNVWRRTRDPRDLEKALKEVVNKKIAKRMKYQQRQKKNQPQGQQAPQWGQQQQQGVPKKQAPPPSPMPLSGQYASAAEQLPDVSGMSVRELRGFIQQSGSSLADQARRCTVHSELLSLAQRCMQLWECTRLISCSNLPQATEEQQLLAALCALRVPTGQGPRQPAAAARGLTASDLKRRFQKLALLVHPDKVLAEHQDRTEEFDVAMKFLGSANALLSIHCASG